MLSLSSPYNASYDNNNVEDCRTWFELNISNVTINNVRDSDRCTAAFVSEIIVEVNI